ncbi:SlyX family protein [Roseovarius sp. D22-M7]|uniref:SlyX family protein n=1 Tax=Roseovarius sp. D22-M7 TaxID=3127116 RepID=UPI003FA7A238
MRRLSRRGLAEGPRRGKPGGAIDRPPAGAYTLRMTEIEEKLAHLIRAVDDLSEVIARQDREIDWLRARVQILLEREAARQEDGEGSVTVGDTRPPHY